MSNFYSYKSCSMAIKDIDTKQGIVTGYFAAYGNVDSDGDIIQKGAGAKSIQERGPNSSRPRIKHLLDHDTTKAVGVIQNLYEDDFGLAFESKLGNHTLGRDALHMYEDGIITEHSIGFNIVNADNSKEHQIIKEYKLWEGSSLQTWGANENTPVTGVKSRYKDNPAKLIDRLTVFEKALRNGKYSDETFEALEIELNQIKQAIQDIISLKDQPKPVADTTLKDKEPNDKALLEFYKSLTQNLKKSGRN